MVFSPGVCLSGFTVGIPSISLPHKWWQQGCAAQWMSLLEQTVLLSEIKSGKCVYVWCFVLQFRTFLKSMSWSSFQWSEVGALLKSLAFIVWVAPVGNCKCLKVWFAFWLWTWDAKNALCGIPAAPMSVLIDKRGRQCGCAMITTVSPLQCSLGLTSEAHQTHVASSCDITCSLDCTGPMRWTRFPWSQLHCTCNYMGEHQEDIWPQSHSHNSETVAQVWSCQNALALCDAPLVIPTCQCDLPLSFLSFVTYFANFKSILKNPHFATHCSCNTMDSQGISGLTHAWNVTSTPLGFLQLPPNWGKLGKKLGGSWSEASASSWGKLGESWRKPGERKATSNRGKAGGKVAQPNPTK